MLSGGSLRMINSLFRTVLSLRTLLFEWDAKLFVMKPVSNHRYMFSILCSIKIWAYLVFAIFRCIQHMKDGVSGKLVVSEVAEIVPLGLGSVLQYTNITRPKEIINGTNQLLNFNIRLRRLYASEREKTERRSNMCEKLMKIFIVVAFAQTGIFCLNFMRDPYRSTYYYSYLDPKIQRDYWPLLRFPFLISLIIDQIIYWNVILLDLYVILIYGCSSVSCLQEINKKNVGSQRTLPILRRKETAFEVYRCVQLLNICFNSCYAKLAMPVLQLCLLLMDVFPLFMTVRLHSSLPLLKFIAIPLRATTTLLLTFYIFPMLANIHQLSIGVTKCWKSSPTIKRNKRDSTFVKSCAPLKVKSGSLFFMRKFTAFKVFGLIIYYTMKLLLIF